MSQERLAQQMLRDWREANGSPAAQLLNYWANDQAELITVTDYEGYTYTCARHIGEQDIHHWSYALHRTREIAHEEASRIAYVFGLEVQI